MKLEQGGERQALFLEKNRVYKNAFKKETVKLEPPFVALNEYSLSQVAP